MFPPSLYRYVTKTLGKHLILVLNKVDLIPAALALAWKDYFVSKVFSLKYDFGYVIQFLTSMASVDFREGLVKMVPLLGIIKLQATF